MIAPAIERVNEAPSKVQLRFLKKDDSPEAATLASTLNRMLGVEVELKDFSDQFNTNSEVKRRTYELWFPHGQQIKIGPDHPAYSFSGQIGGQSQKSAFNSDESGTLVASAIVRSDRPGSFNDMTLVSSWDASLLRFKYVCIYRSIPEQNVQSPPSGDGQDCPSGGSGSSRYIRAVTISLDGPMKDKYQLEYQCWIGYFGQPTLSELGKAKEGELCGHTSGGAPVEWISKLEIHLSRR